MNEISFSSLEQRVAQTYLDTLAPFVPAEDGPDAAEQKRFYDRMAALYQLAFDEPTLFVNELHEDDAHPNRFNKSSYGKPKLKDDMRKFIKVVDALLDVMFQIGNDPGQAKISKRYKVIFERLGIDTAVPCEAWRWMTQKPGATLFAFSRCLFKEGYPYPSEIFAKLLGEPFRALEQWMAARGYQRFDYLDGKMSVEWANPAWGPVPPRGGFEYKVRHTGISVRYDELVKTPQVLGLCIPGGMKDYLNAFDKMDERIQDFVAKHSTRCWGCRYCVQTDKTGKRPLAYIPISHGGETLNLCPYFPGCSYNWTSIDGALVDDLTAMLQFMDDRHREGAVKA